jgi:hypothetical protein
MAVKPHYGDLHIVTVREVYSAQGSWHQVGGFRILAVPPTIASEVAIIGAMLAGREALGKLQPSVATELVIRFVQFASR